MTSAKYQTKYQISKSKNAVIASSVVFATPPRRGKQSRVSAESPWIASATSLRSSREALQAPRKDEDLCVFEI